MLNASKYEEVPKYSVVNFTVSFCLLYQLISSLVYKFPFSCLEGLFIEREVGWTNQTNSRHTEQKVGCLKNVALNSWFFIKWTLACLMAPRLRCSVGPSSSLAASLLSVGYEEKHTSVLPQYCNGNKLIALMITNVDPVNWSHMKPVNDKVNEGKILTNGWTVFVSRDV